jgi:hypothetical protein
VASLTLEPGEDDTAVINLPEDDPYAFLNGSTLTVKSSPFDFPVKYVLRNQVTPVPAGYNATRDENAFELIAVDAENQTVPGEFGCDPNEIEISKAVMDGLSSYIAIERAGIYGTGLYLNENGDFVEPGQETEEGMHESQVTDKGTQIITNHASTYAYLNSAPHIELGHTISADKHITLNLQGTMDENEAYYQNVTVDGFSFSQDASNPHLWRSDEPFNDGTYILNVTVEGRNGGPQDTSSAQTQVEVGGLCDGINYDDGNLCNGTEQCDPDTGSMLSGNDAPAGTECNDGNPDTVADECDGSGTCAGITPECTQNTQCNDSNDCTVDTCNADYECVNTPDVGATCDDGDSSTDPDTCNSVGVCEGVEIAAPVINNVSVNCGSYCDTGLTYKGTITFTGEYTDIESEVTVTANKTPGTVENFTLIAPGTLEFDYFPSRDNSGGQQETIEIRLENEGGLSDPISITNILG